MSSVIENGTVTQDAEIVHKPATQALTTSAPASADVALFDQATFAQMQKTAMAMGTSTLCPKHLRANDPKETIGNCLRVVNQAYRWNFDPFAVADSSYVVGGKLGYEGKLVAAVVNARSDMVGGLQPIYNDKKGDDFAVVIYGSRKPITDEQFELLEKYVDNEDRKALRKLTFQGVKAIRLTVAQGKTDNKMWTKDPEQKLFYTGATKWARRHTPELMHGVLTDDDLEKMVVEGRLEGEPTIRVVSPQSLDRLVDQRKAKQSEVEPVDEPMADDGEIPMESDAEVTLPAVFGLIDAAGTNAQLDDIRTRFVGPDATEGGFAAGEWTEIDKLIADKRAKLNAKPAKGQRSLMDTNPNTD